MKTIKFIIAIAFSVALNINSFAQMHDHSTMATANKTQTIKVWGNCGTCKARIEKTAKVDGVSKASWDNKTNILTLVYDPSKVNTDDIQKKLAAVGHDTEKYTADTKAYNALPMCCKYERKQIK